MSAEQETQTMTQGLWMQWIIDSAELVEKNNDLVQAESLYRRAVELAQLFGNSTDVPACLKLLSEFYTRTNNSAKKEDVEKLLAQFHATIFGKPAHAAAQNTAC
jgi:hypothetical protein